MLLLIHHIKCRCTERKFRRIISLHCPVCLEFRERYSFGFCVCFVLLIFCSYHCCKTKINDSFDFREQILDEQTLRREVQEMVKPVNVLLARHFYSVAPKSGERAPFHANRMAPGFSLQYLWPNYIFNVFGTPETIASTWLADSAVFLVHIINLDVNFISLLYPRRMLASWSLNPRVWCNLIPQTVIAAMEWTLY